MLNCLAGAIPGGERIVSAEEVFELRFSHPDWVPMQTRQAGLEGTGEIRLRELVKEALRTRMSSFRTMKRRSEWPSAGAVGVPEGCPGHPTISSTTSQAESLALIGAVPRSESRRSNDSRLAIYNATCGLLGG